MPLNIICGYDGSSAYTLALMRGEVDMVSKAWNAMRVEDKDTIENGTLIPILQGGLKRESELPNVPLMQELTDDPNAKKALTFLSNPLSSLFVLSEESYMAKKRIGILTGGGDVPGLNSVIKTVVYRGARTVAKSSASAVAGKGLTHVNLDDPASRARYILPLNRDNTRTIDRTGGTFLHSSRTNPAEDEEAARCSAGQEFPSRKSTKKGVTQHGLRHDPAGPQKHRDAAARLPDRHRRRRHAELCGALDQQGVKVIAIPKTMDNDVRNTEYCIGFSTAITRATEAIDRQRTTVGSHERIGIFRIFGRDAGYTALYTAYVTSIRCCIPEYKFNLEN